MKTLFVATDHAGLEFKNKLLALSPTLPWKDLGTHSTASVDYPDFAKKLCESILNAPVADQTTGEVKGVLICGSGIGMSIAANRFKGIRAALVSNPIEARLATEHNHANVLCLGARFLAPEYALEMIQAWLSAKPSQEPRHLNRVKKL